MSSRLLFVLFMATLVNIAFCGVKCYEGGYAGGQVREHKERDCPENTCLTIPEKDNEGKETAQTGCGHTKSCKDKQEKENYICCEGKLCNKVASTKSSESTSIAASSQSTSIAAVALLSLFIV